MQAEQFQLEALLWPRKATNCGPVRPRPAWATPREPLGMALGLHSCKRSACLPPVQATHKVQHLKRGVDYNAATGLDSKVHGTSWEVIRDVLG
jgi:hypothetical protein